MISPRNVSTVASERESAGRLRFRFISNKMDRARRELLGWPGRKAINGMSHGAWQ